MKSQAKKIAFAMLTIMWFIGSCKKEEDKKEYDTQTAENSALAEITFNDLNNIVSQAVESHSLSTYRHGFDPGNFFDTTACVQITWTPDSTGPGGNVVVDFGSGYCYCQDQRYRRGIINIHYTGAYRDSGTIITTTLQNYYVGTDILRMYKVEGTKTVTNKGHNAAGYIWYDINVSGVIIDVDNKHLTWNSTRQRFWIGGEQTATWIDDEYVITGTATGTSFSGKNFTLNITSGIHVRLNCRWITQGTFVLTPEGLAARTLDYGNGDCDNVATVSVNGFTLTVHL